MAPRNPTIQPTNDPNFTAVTRPISIPDSINPRGVEANRILPEGQKIGDRSAEFEGKAAGVAAEAKGAADKGMTDLFAGVVGIGDFLGKAGVQMVRQDIENKVYEVADAERQRYTAQLESIKNSGSTKAIISGDGVDANGNTPEELRSLPDQLEVLRSARDGGKLTSTDYQARLLAAAKDLRARYPGFKTEIDQEFSKVTGHNPANAYITGLVADINRQGSTQNSEIKSLQAYVLSHSGIFPDARKVSEGLATGEYTRGDIIQMAAPYERKEAVLKLRDAEFKDAKLSKEQRIDKGKEYFDEIADSTVTLYVDKLMHQLGINSPADALLVNGRTKSGDISAQQWNQLGRSIMDTELGLRKTLYDDAKARGIVAAIGADETLNRINVYMKRLDPLKGSVFDKDSGGLYHNARTVKGMSDDDTKNVYQDSIIGPPARLAAVFKETVGPQAAAQFFLKQQQDGLDGKLTNYAHNMEIAIATQTDMATTGIPITLNRVFDEYNVKAKNASASERQKMNANVVNAITTIAEPDTSEKQKLNYAAAAFHPSNLGFISRLNEGSQNSVYQKLSSEQMTNEMYRLGKTHPEVWRQYVNWNKETLANELISREIRDLAQVRNPTISIGWDDKNHILVPSYKGKDMPDTSHSDNPFEDMRRKAAGIDVYNTNSRGRSEYDRVVALTNRINSNLSNFKHIAVAANQNVDEFVLKTIYDAAGPEALRNIDNLPGQIIRAIGLTKMKKNDNSN